MKIRLVLYLCVAIVSNSISVNLSAEGARSKNLATPVEFAALIADKNTVIVDASFSQMYQKKHIPNALNFDIFQYGPSEPDNKETELRFRKLGIKSGKKIAIYDQGGSFLATRLFFSLTYHGFPSDDIIILDGGLFQWESKGFPVTAEVTVPPEMGDFTVTTEWQHMKSGLPEFLTASGDTENNILLEALEADWHYGAKQYFDRAGHIPYSIMLPPGDFFNGDKTFKKPEEINAILQYLKIDENKNVYTYCGGGIAASVPYFALKYIMGYKNVKLFPGSLLEWVQDKRELPVWTYDKPHMLRNSSWLKVWAGKWMKAYGLSKLNIVDVRNAKAYSEQRIAASVNIEGEVLNFYTVNPSAIELLLNKTGIVSNYEAVIFSGEGLTKEAALVWAVLSQGGLETVSIFTDNIQTAKGAGIEFIRDTIKVKQADLIFKQDGSSNNPEQHNRIFIKDTSETSGFFPKVYIKSHHDAGNQNSAGSSLFLNYKELLDSSGSPRPAAEILSVLTKIKLPRYAEIICAPADPGEAAIILFILKLMGYPDVKILLN